MHDVSDRPAGPRVRSPPRVPLVPRHAEELLRVGLALQLLVADNLLQFRQHLHAHDDAAAPDGRRKEKRAPPPKKKRFVTTTNGTFKGAAGGRGARTCTSGCSSRRPGR